MRIGIDAHGGDNAPKAIIEAVKQSISKVDSMIVLYGKKDILEKEIEKANLDISLIEIVETKTIVTNEDKPVVAVKKKSDSSMIKGLMDLRKNKIDAFLSAGNTGALLAGSLLRVGRIKGVDRPALVIGFPTSKGMSVLLDAGANAECKSRNLKEFSIMGSIYAEEIIGIKNPSVGLVNIGEEKGKGTALVKESYDVLDQVESINFKGNVEAREIPEGAVDVIVCDGFTGNIILKLAEGVVSSMSGMLKKAFTKNIFTKVSALLVKSGLKEMKRNLDYTEYGGAPLLGVKELVVKAHGSSNTKAFKNAIIYAEKALKSNVVKKINDKINKE